MNSAERKPIPLLPLAFVAAVVAFAWWRFSDNTVDNDLWGHVLYGQRMIALGHVEAVDPFSWTAGGSAWINHEVLAEVVLGAVHQLAGGTGLWLLSVGTAVLTIVLAWREARRECHEPGHGLTFAALFAVSTNGIATGFSARPQLFTMVALVVLLTEMRRLSAGSRSPLIVLPLLCWVWINTHGGVLAGLLLLAVAALVTLGHRLTPHFRFLAFFSRRNFDEDPYFATPRRGSGPAFLTATVLALLAACITPWGPASLRWLVASVSYLRPEITEWRPTPVDFAYLPFWFTAAASVAAWLWSRRPHRAWEAAALAVLLAMAIRHERHVPLFCLANLVLTPPHLLECLRSLAGSVPDLLERMRSLRTQLTLSVLLGLAAIAAVTASFWAPREEPWTMEVERDQYPCAALNFLGDHPLDGNLLVFFDWGQQAMWELPRNPVSFDGRLDTVYPHDVIEAHWQFYRGDTPDPAVLDLNRADVALLPTNRGGMILLRRLGWTLVYTDPLASILVRRADQYPDLATMTLPIRAGAEAVAGRETFPAEPSARANPGSL
ncbi:MAG: hypothetical protein JSR48_16000 [Verrucomicrobia bacterium]|nr:hypothetical protein [Verrucomicrobiota bacterium]